MLMMIMVKMLVTPIYSQFIATIVLIRIRILMNTPHHTYSYTVIPIARVVAVYCGSNIIFTCIHMSGAENRFANLL